MCGVGVCVYGLYGSIRGVGGVYVYTCVYVCMYSVCCVDYLYVWSYIYLYLYIYVVLCYCRCMNRVGVHITHKIHYGSLNRICCKEVEG